MPTLRLIYIEKSVWEPFEKTALSPNPDPLD
jgi:hypothetical protein